MINPFIFLDIPSDDLFFQVQIELKNVKQKFGEENYEKDFKFLENTLFELFNSCKTFQKMQSKQLKAKAAYIEELEEQISNTEC